MTEFTRAGLISLREEINKALEPIAAKHGLIIGLGNGRYSSSEAHFTKLTLIPRTPAPSYIKTASASSPGSGVDPYNTVESREYINLAYMFALPKDGLGRQFKTFQGTYTIVGLKSNRRKYPVLGVSARGTRYKFTADQVKKGLI